MTTLDVSSPTVPRPDAEVTELDFWFDPTCPYTWRTHRWLSTLAAARQVTVRWHLMSLAILHHGAVAPTVDDDGKAVAFGQAARCLRVLAAAERTAGQEGLARLYALTGSRKHEAGGEFTDAVLRQTVADAGLPAAVADAMDEEGLDNVIRASHDDGQARGGMQMGSPVLAFDGGRGYFGPVLTEVPPPDDAVQLLDGLRLVVGVGAFSELKTSR